MKRIIVALLVVLGMASCTSNNQSESFPEGQKVYGNSSFGTQIYKITVDGKQYLVATNASGISIVKHSDHE